MLTQNDFQAFCRQAYNELYCSFLVSTGLPFGDKKVKSFAKKVLLFSLRSMSFQLQIVGRYRLKVPKIRYNIIYFIK